MVYIGTLLQLAFTLAEYATLPPQCGSLCGGWEGHKRRAADFAAVGAAVGLWRAAGLAVMQRAHGSDLPLRQIQ